jgi:arylsulfatase A-like enzyme
MDKIAPASFGTNRVRLLLSALFMICSGASVCFAQPNVILIVCDDLNDSVEGMGGHIDAKTPQIQEIMEAGVRFTNAHCNAPICGPSRASLWTGLLPSTSGYYGFDQQSNDWRDFDLLSDAVTLMEHFKANNYTVWGSGKIFHNGHDDNTVFSVNPASDGAGPSDFGPFPWNGVDPGSGNYTGEQHPDMPTSNWGYYPSTTSLDNNPGDTVGYGDYDWALKSGPFNYTSEASPLGIDGDIRDLMPDEISAQWAEGKLGQTHNNPFLMVVGMNRPHAPFYAPKEFFDLFRDEDGNNTVSLPPHLPNTDDLDDLPEIAKGRPSGDLLNRGYQSGMDKYKQDYGNGANEWWLNFVQGYLACVAFADHQIGVIWDALQASDYASNTIVIVTSDHGYHLGEKDHSSKTTPWEETTRVPLVIYTPEMRSGGSLESVAGLECSAPVSLIDLYPTLNVLCDMPADPNGGAGKNNTVLDGNDLTRLLEAPLAGQWDGPSVSLSHLHNARVDWPEGTKSPWALNHHAVRSENYRYIRYSDGSEELYDHSLDPNEWTNQAGNAAYAPAKTVMKRRLFESLGLANTNNLVVNGSFESDLSNWVVGGSAGAILDTSNSLAGDRSALVTSNATVSSEVLVDYEFNDADGTLLNSNLLSNEGSDTGSWNFGHFKAQAGALNVGYTQEFKSPLVDDNLASGSTNTVFRLYTLTSAITSGEFEFIVDISEWDLRRNWDSASSAEGKGVQFSLMSGSSSVNVRFETSGASGFRANVSGLATGNAYGNAFDFPLNRLELNGGLLRISGNLDSGAWTAFANDGEGGAYKTITSGSGLTSIDGIRFNALSPSDGSWGGAGAGNAPDPAEDGTSGDYMRIDHITLSNTITALDGGLEQNMLAVLEPGKSYHVSAWARSSSSGAVQLEMQETSGSGQATDFAIGSVAANDTEFLLIEGDYTVPDNLTGLSLIAQGAGFSLDHVQVYEYQTPNIVASVVIDDGDGSISLGWNAELGVSYRLEQSLDLANDWTVLESDLTADKSKMIRELTVDPSLSRAFWRVIKNP